MFDDEVTVVVDDLSCQAWELADRLECELLEAAATDIGVNRPFWFLDAPEEEDEDA